MKFLLASLLLFTASAFSPNSLPKAHISSTGAHGVVDPHILEHLAQYGEQAATAMFINCDNNGCELVEGIHESDGWYFDSKGPTDASMHTQMLGMSMEDTE